MHQMARKGEVTRTDMMGWEEQVGWNGWMRWKGELEWSEGMDGIGWDGQQDRGNRWDRLRGKYGKDEGVG